MLVADVVRETFRVLDLAGVLAAHQHKLDDALLTSQRASHELAEAQRARAEAERREQSCREECGRVEREVVDSSSCIGLAQ